MALVRSKVDYRFDRVDSGGSRSCRSAIRRTFLHAPDARSPSVHHSQANTAYLPIGRPYIMPAPTICPGGGPASPQSRCCINIPVRRDTSSCRPATVWLRRSFSICSCSTLVWSSLSQAFLRCRHLSAAVHVSGLPFSDSPCHLTSLGHSQIQGREIVI